MASDDFLQVLAGASLISLEDSPQLLRASMLSRFAAARMAAGDMDSSLPLQSSDSPAITGKQPPRSRLRRRPAVAEAAESGDNGCCEASGHGEQCGSSSSGEADLAVKQQKQQQQQQSANGLATQQLAALHALLDDSCSSDTSYLPVQQQYAPTPTTQHVGGVLRAGAAALAASVASGCSEASGFFHGFWSRATPRAGQQEGRQGSVPPMTPDTTMSASGGSAAARADDDDDHHHHPSQVFVQQPQPVVSEELLTLLSLDESVQQEMATATRTAVTVANAAAEVVTHSPAAAAAAATDSPAHDSTATAASGTPPGAARYRGTQYCPLSPESPVLMTAGASAGCFGSPQVLLSSPAPHVAAVPGIEVSEFSTPSPPPRRVVAAAAVAQAAEGKNLSSDIGAPDPHDDILLDDTEEPRPINEAGGADEEQEEQQQQQQQQVPAGPLVVARGSSSTTTTTGNSNLLSQLLAESLECWPQDARNAQHNDTGVSSLSPSNNTHDAIESLFESPGPLRGSVDGASTLPCGTHDGAHTPPPKSAPMLSADIWASAESLHLAMEGLPYASATPQAPSATTAAAAATGGAGGCMRITHALRAGASTPPPPCSQQQQQQQRHHQLRLLRRSHSWSAFEGLATLLGGAAGATPLPPSSVACKNGWAPAAAARALQRRCSAVSRPVGPALDAAAAVAEEGANADRRGDAPAAAAVPQADCSGDGDCVLLPLAKQGEQQQQQEEVLAAAAATLPPSPSAAGATLVTSREDGASCQQGTAQLAARLAEAELRVTLQQCEVVQAQQVALERELQMRVLSAALASSQAEGSSCLEALAAAVDLATTGAEGGGSQDDENSDEQRTCVQAAGCDTDDADAAAAATARARAEKAEAAAAAAESRCEELRITMAEAARELDALTAARDAAAADAAASAARADAVAADAERLTAERDAAAAELESAQRDAEAAREAARVQVQQLLADRDKLREANAALADAEASFAAAQVSLAARARELEAQLMASDARHAGMTEALQELQAQNASLSDLCQSLRNAHGIGDPARVQQQQQHSAEGEANAGPTPMRRRLAAVNAQLERRCQELLGQRQELEDQLRAAQRSGSGGCAAESDEDGVEEGEEGSTCVESSGLATQLAELAAHNAELRTALDAAEAHIEELVQQHAAALAQLQALEKDVQQEEEEEEETAVTTGASGDAPASHRPAAAGASALFQRCQDLEQQLATEQRLRAAAEAASEAAAIAAVEARAAAAHAQGEAAAAAATKAAAAGEVAQRAQQHLQQQPRAEERACSAADSLVTSDALLTAATPQHDVGVQVALGARDRATQAALLAAAQQQLRDMEAHNREAAGRLADSRRRIAALQADAAAQDAALAAARTALADVAGGSAARELALEARATAAAAALAAAHKELDAARRAARDADTRCAEQASQLDTARAALAGVRSQLAALTAARDADSTNVAVVVGELDAARRAARALAEAPSGASIECARARAADAEAASAAAAARERAARDELERCRAKVAALLEGKQTVALELQQTKVAVDFLEGSVRRLGAHNASLVAQLHDALTARPGVGSVAGTTAGALRAPRTSVGVQCGAPGCDEARRAVVVGGGVSPRTLQHIIAAASRVNEKNKHLKRQLQALQLGAAAPPDLQ